MTENELEGLLQVWGLAFAQHGRDDADLGWGSNPIATGMEYALGSRSAVIRSKTNMERSGNTRRALMGRGAGVERMRAVPKWACDPITGKATRGGPGSSKTDPLFTPDIERVQQAVMALYRIDTLRGTCVICEYQLRHMTQAEKAVRVAQLLASPVKLNRYRDELKSARTWLHGRLAA